MIEQASTLISLLMQHSGRVKSNGIQYIITVACERDANSTAIFEAADLCCMALYHRLFREL